MFKSSNLIDDDNNSDNIVTVYNLPLIFDDSDVRALFANVGTVLECSIKHDETKSYNIAIIKFSSQQEQDVALELSGVSVRYHILKIIKGHPPVIAIDKSNDFESTIAKVKEIRDKITKRLTSKASEEYTCSVKPTDSGKKSEPIKSTSGSKGGYRRRGSRSHSRDRSGERYSRYRRSRSRSRRRSRRSYSRSTRRSSTDSLSSGYRSRSSYRSDTDSSDYSHSRYGRRRYGSRSRPRSKRRYRK